MYYCIKREIINDIPFDQTWMSFRIKGDVYDIVKAPKDTGLDKISDFIVDENLVAVKTDPRLDKIFKEEFQKTTDLTLNELLLG